MVSPSNHVRKGLGDYAFAHMGKRTGHPTVVRQAHHDTPSTAKLNSQGLFKDIT
jgi:hypothetical protein